MRPQLLDRTGMQRARPRPVAGRQTQRVGRGPVLCDDDNLGRGRQRTPQVEQHELAEPILYAAPEQISTEQQPSKRGGERYKARNTQPGPTPPRPRRVV
jgi:hypothetical protein